MQNTMTPKKISNRTKESFGDKIFLIIAYGILLALAFCCLYPLYFTVIASISDAYNVYRGEVFLLPKGFTFEAYTLEKEASGVPVIGDDQLPHYPMTPEDFTAILRDCKAMGANLLGGCCGTDPAFIAGLRDTLM